jgi:hypothetical protein
MVERARRRRTATSDLRLRVVGRRSQVAVPSERGDARAPEPLQVAGAEVRVGTASWTDPTLLVPGLFYPEGVDTPEARLRYYASRFPLVEIDSTYYALPTRRVAALWAERAPRGSCSTSRRTRR